MKRDAQGAVSIDNLLSPAALFLSCVASISRIARSVPSRSAGSTRARRHLRTRGEAPARAGSRRARARGTVCRRPPPRASSGRRRRSRGRRRAAPRRGSRALRAARSRRPEARVRADRERASRRRQEAARHGLRDLGAEPARIASAGRHENASKRTGCIPRRQPPVRRSKRRVPGAGQPRRVVGRRRGDGHDECRRGLGVAVVAEDDERKPRRRRPSSGSRR